jgi:hypothetical protein
MPELLDYIFNNIPDVLILTKLQRFGICVWKSGFIRSLAFVISVVDLDSHIRTHSKLFVIIILILLCLTSVLA